MNWLIIGLILIAAFGPVLWMLPSKGDRRLAKMRARARTHGMQVEMTSVADPNAQPSARVTAGGRPLSPTIQCAAYRLALRRPAYAAPQWKLLRNALQMGEPVAGWQWDGAPAGDAAYWRQVSDIVRDLPADALACAAQQSEVACWWRERVSAEEALAAVDALYETLAKVAEIQRVADASATPDDIVGATSDASPTGD